MWGQRFSHFLGAYKYKTSSRPRYDSTSLHYNNSTRICLLIIRKHPCMPDFFFFKMRNCFPFFCWFCFLVSWPQIWFRKIPLTFCTSMFPPRRMEIPSSMVATTISLNWPVSWQKPAYQCDRKVHSAAFYTFFSTRSFWVHWFCWENIPLPWHKSHQQKSSQ